MRKFRDWFLLHFFAPAAKNANGAYAWIWL